MHQREEGIIRLYPSLFSSRRYSLIQLRKQMERVISEFIDSKNQLLLIDYGCGNMPYLPLFQSHVKKYIGVDLPENPRADVHITAEGRILHPDNSADIVLSTQVLEHVNDPLFYLQEAYRILKPGGILILSTHGYWIYHPDPTDYWRWTSSGLKKIISEQGFEIEYFHGIIGRAAMGLQLFQDGFIFKLPKIVLEIFSFAMQILISFFDNIATQKSKDSDAGIFMVVAKARKNDAVQP